MCMVCAVAATAAYLSFFPSLLHDNSKPGVKLCYQDLDSPMADLSICTLTLSFLYESSQLHAATVFSGQHNTSSWSVAWVACFQWFQHIKWFKKTLTYTRHNRGYKHVTLISAEDEQHLIRPIQNPSQRLFNLPVISLRQTGTNLPWCVCLSSQ